MSDVEKLMARMNNNKQPVEEVVKEVKPVAEIPQVEEIPEVVAEIKDDEDDDKEVAEVPKVTEVPKVAENLIEQEVGILQNDGIYRRERIIIEREKVDVLKVIAQLLIDHGKKTAK